MLSQTGNSGRPDPAQTPSTLSELLDDYAAFATRVRNLAQDTVKTHRLYLQRFLSTLGAESPPELFASLTATTLQRFIFEYAEDHGSGSRRWMQFTLRCFLRFCYYQGYLSADLSAAIPAFSSRRLSSVPYGIDDDTVRLLIESIDADSPMGLRDLAIIFLLSTYGVRGIQVRQLCLHDIDWVNSQIYFRPVKNGKPITQHLTPKVGNSLLAYLLDGRRNTTPYDEVFLTSRPPFRPFRASGSFSGIIHRRLLQIDVQLPRGVSRGTHSFRHYADSRIMPTLSGATSTLTAFLTN